MIWVFATVSPEGASESKLQLNRIIPASGPGQIRMLFAGSDGQDQKHSALCGSSSRVLIRERSEDKSRLITDGFIHHGRRGRWRTGWEKRVIPAGVRVRGVHLSPAATMAFAPALPILPCTEDAPDGQDLVRWTVPDSGGLQGARPLVILHHRCSPARLLPAGLRRYPPAAGGPSRGPKRAGRSVRAGSYRPWWRSRSAPGSSDRPCRPGIRASRSGVSQSLGACRNGACRNAVSHSAVCRRGAVRGVARRAGSASGSTGRAIAPPTLARSRWPGALRLPCTGVPLPNSSLLPAGLDPRALKWPGPGLGRPPFSLRWLGRGPGGGYRCPQRHGPSLRHDEAWRFQPLAQSGGPVTIRALAAATSRASVPSASASAICLPRPDEACPVPPHPVRGTGPAPRPAPAARSPRGESSPRGGRSPRTSSSVRDCGPRSAPLRTTGCRRRAPAGWWPATVCTCPSPGRPRSMATPSRRRSSSSSVGWPLTFTRYVFSTPVAALVSLLARSPSLVTSSSPSLR